MRVTPIAAFTSRNGTAGKRRRKKR